MGAGNTALILVIGIIMDASEYENKVVDKLYYDFRKFSQCYYDISARMKSYSGEIKLAVRIDCFDQYQNFKFTYSVIVDNAKVKTSVRINEKAGLSSIHEKFIKFLDGYDWKYLLNKNNVSVDYAFMLDMPSYANKIKMYKVRKYIGNSFVFCLYDSKPSWCLITRETPKLYEGSVFAEGNEHKFKASKKSILQNIVYPFIAETDYKRDA